MEKRTRWPHHLTESRQAACRNAAAPSAPRQVVRWVIGIGVAGLLLFGPGMYHLVRLSLAQRRLDKQLSELSAEQARLTSLEQRLHDDPAYVEGLIRTTFKVSQPGEYVIPLDSPDRRE